MNGFSIKTSVATNNLVDNASLPIFNASYLLGDSISINNLIIGDSIKYNGIEWINSPSTLGPTGYTGAIGPTGLDGSVTMTGATGSVGETGPTGDVG